MRRSPIRALLIAAAGVALTAAPEAAAQVQVPDTQTGIASPGRVEEQIIDRTLELREMPRIEVRETEIVRAPEGAETVSFRLDQLMIEGVQVYSEDQIAPLYQGMLGRAVTLAELYGLAAALTRKYRNDGYILTQVVVPPQTIEDGTARLMVVEGYIDNIEIRDAEGSAAALIRRYADQMRTAGRALNVNELERALLTINDLAGVTARAILSPSPIHTGAADMTIIVERRPFDALIAIDNHGTRYLGPIQLSAAASLNSLLGLNERITAQFVMAPQSNLDSELYYGGLSYAQPVFGTGTVLELSGTRTWTEPGWTLADFGVTGRSESLRAKLRHPFIRTRQMNLFGHTALDYRNIKSSNDFEETRKDRIRALRLGGRFEYIDNFFGAAFNSADLELSRGLNIFGATGAGDQNVTRVGADSDFFKLEAELQRLQRLGPSVNLLLATSGQWASKALYSAEEFGVGGLNYGRGYDPSEIIGDHGLAGKLELQWNTPYALTYVPDYQLFGFYDAGRIWNEDPLTASQKRQSRTSAGLGVRAQFSEKASAGLMVALPLSDDVGARGNRKPRLFVNISRRF